MSGVVITKWTKATQPVGANDRVFGFIAVDWHGLVVEGFQVIDGPRGLFVEFPRWRTRWGRWLPVVRFDRVKKREDFKAEVLAALMRTYPEDFGGTVAELRCPTGSLVDRL